MPSAPLAALLPAEPTSDAGVLLERFLAWVQSTGLTLYPAQEEALLELMAGKHVLLATPTGSGKSLVAIALHFKALAEGRISFYTAPIKALANEKFFALCELFGAERVGMLTGDASINRTAPIICCTAEVLANLAVREAEPRVDAVVMDEFHYYGDRDRGVAWQIPLLTLPRATFLLMSATLGDTTAIEQSIHDLTGREVVAVRSAQRPVPLEYEYRETPLHETLEDLVQGGKAPVYLVNFSQRAAAEQAQALTSANVTTREEKEALRQVMTDVRFDSPFGKDMNRLLSHGIGLHHAGLLPKYRLLCEKLAQAGRLKVVSGTDTLGVGVNIPIRTVLFTQLSKYDGEKTAQLTARDFHQIAGRAGRKGFDERGWVVAQAPEHVIENLRLSQKAAAGKKVTRKPPPKGFVGWDRQSFEKLVARPPEPLQSRFDVTHGLLLNLLQADAPERGGGYGRLVRIIGRAHVSDVRRRQILKKTAVLFRTLRAAGLVSTFKHPHARSAEVEVSPELQRDFSLHQTLSLYLVDTLPRLDREPTYALDVVTLVESILEDPTIVLLKQLDALKTARLAELKAQGVEYAERMEELDKLEHPKPLRDFIYGTFDAFAAKHPWVGHENIRPKSVARDMLERFATFNDYVREYELQRSEGVLLRYLSDAYKTLAQTVPESYRDEALEEALQGLRRTVREADSSLLDEWERLQHPDAARAPPIETGGPQGPSDKAVAARIRSELHRLLKAIADRSWEDALACLAPGQDWTAESLEAEAAPYFAAHERIVLTPEARRPSMAVVRSDGPAVWEARQKILDPDGEADWMLDCSVMLPPGSLPDGPILMLRRIGT